MSDIIRLLPDAVANQIAAGEVIQRPASAVKELLENAVDAGATRIQLIVQDAGRTLIQVIDNGKGMTDTDARLCFERHATSKISSADDLFNLRTMGFRGEALASIAAVAHVELRTRRPEDEIGTCIRTEGSKILSQEPVNCPAGASFSVKNLYFNVPARRNFLKSDAAEFRHILDEFERVALAHPHIAFTLHHNGTEMFNLTPGNLRQRITGLCGNPYNQRLVPVDETTDIVRITGFVVKPEYARKSRGEQYFFLNTRFIKNSYLHHAVQGAFEQLLAPDTHPGYFLFLEVDPKTIDVNIHPTKTEVKFEDDRSVYAILRSAVKRALGQYSISPSLDFEQEMSIELPYKPATAPVSAPGIHVNPNYNPFATESSPSTTQGGKTSYNGSGLSTRDKNNLANWQELYDLHTGTKNAEPSFAPEPETSIQQHSAFDEEPEQTKGIQVWQIHDRYIVSTIKSGVIVIDQQRAHERILYERYLRSLEQHAASCQQILFPETVELPVRDAALLTQLLDSVNALGFDIRPFGPRSFVIHGIPAGTEEQDAQHLLTGMLADYQQTGHDVQLDTHAQLARALARQTAIRPGRSLSIAEMQTLTDELFATSLPAHAPDGKPALITFGLDELDKRFKR
ncbi:MAG: DNA mismatch repair endonuclease MutL [Bacteroidia bacterium]|jgi:DNA mismatch repair protein MutL|nr:DNA mismatch repair endonuclease MutL [Bacteroidia bacterium]